jgi:O-antigen/teichoic acid export membrane protein
MVARERGRAGEWLGSGLALRGLLLAPVVLLLFAGCAALGYDAGFLGVLALVLAALVCAAVSNACQDAFRGFERTDFGAKSYVAWQALTVLVVLPTLLLGGRLIAFLVAQAACAGVGALVLLRCLGPMGVPALLVRRAALRALFAAGTTFLVFNLVLALQTNLDAVFLSRLATPEAVGWNAAARKLTGVLVFPANALISALYPTLCRLHGTDASAFGATARSALRASLLAAVPVALGCGLFPELGIALFGRAGYGPAADNLRVLAGFLLLVFVSMPLGTTLVAAGRQRAWAAVQFACVIVSALFDPLLVPWFQSHAGNGGLGVCVTNVGSEVLMVGGALWLLPRGVLDRTLLRSAVVALGGGLAMAAIGGAGAALTPYAVAPLAVLGYAGVVWLSGEFGPAQLRALRATLRGQGAGPGAPAAAADPGKDVP